MWIKYKILLFFYGIKAKNPAPSEFAPEFWTDLVKASKLQLDLELTCRVFISNIIIILFQRRLQQQTPFFDYFSPDSEEDNS